jgi:hypothetical protein
MQHEERRDGRDTSDQPPQVGSTRSIRSNTAVPSTAAGGGYERRVIASHRLARRAERVPVLGGRSAAQAGAGGSLQGHEADLLRW